MPFFSISLLSISIYNTLWSRDVSYKCLTTNIHVPGSSIPSREACRWPHQTFTFDATDRIALYPFDISFCTRIKIYQSLASRTDGTKYKNIW